jgi:predicted metal-dependent phosphoesterase TrpH
MNNGNYIDLHVHSNYSDGSMKPAEIIAAAINAGLRMVALTDHDTIGGVKEALDAAAGWHSDLKDTIDNKLENNGNRSIDLDGAIRHKPEKHYGRDDKPSNAEWQKPDECSGREVSAGSRIIMVPGVEISADYAYPLHILGYFSPDNYEKIGAFLEEMMYERNKRNLGIINKLNSLGIRISSEEVAEIAGKEVYGRPHIAAALVKKDVAQSPAAAFHEFLMAGRKAFVGKRSRPPHECVAAIAEAGGLPVIAHPVKLGMRFQKVRALAESLIDSGLYGIEVYYSDNTRGETESYAGLTAGLGLHATGGSDFHGEYRKHIRLGSGRDGNLHVPDKVADDIVEALKIG